MVDEPTPGEAVLVITETRAILDEFRDWLVHVLESNGYETSLSVGPDARALRPAIRCWRRGWARRDRLLALGFDSTYPLGSLNVSLFDVADAKQPKLLERVSFGGEWAGYAEDQNRIHKALTALDDLGLVLVPYGWWVWHEDWNCDDCYCDCPPCWDEGYWERSGAVQLIDWTHSTLALRGAAPLASWARRARIHDTRLLAVSDEEVSCFDIDDRSHPVKTDHQPLKECVGEKRSWPEVGRRDLARLRDP